jgi:Zn ribbon nucleic-acid-binding protein
MNITTIKSDLDILFSDIKEYAKNVKRENFVNGGVCPHCKTHNKYLVVDSRYSEETGRIRKKKCKKCGFQWKTQEVMYYG